MDTHHDKAPGIDKLTKKIAIIGNSCLVAKLAIDEIILPWCLDRWSYTNQGDLVNKNVLAETLWNYMKYLERFIKIISLHSDFTNKDIEAETWESVRRAELVEDPNFYTF